MGADELHEGYLAVKIESNHQTVVSSCNFEPDALTALSCVLMYLIGLASVSARPATLFLDYFHSSILKSPSDGRSIRKCHRRSPVDCFRAMDCGEAYP